RRRSQQLRAIGFGSTRRASRLQQRDRHRRVREPGLHAHRRLQRRDAVGEHQRRLRERPARDAHRERLRQTDRRRSSLVHRTTPPTAGPSPSLTTPPTTDTAGQTPPTATATATAGSYNVTADSGVGAFASSATFNLTNSDSADLEIVKSAPVSALLGDEISY